MMIDRTAMYEGSQTWPACPSKDISITPEHWWNDTDKRKSNYSDKNPSKGHLSTTNPTRTGLGSNPCLRDEKPATV